MERMEVYCSCVGGSCSGEREANQGPTLPDPLLHHDPRPELWTWDPVEKSHEVTLYGMESRTAMFHPGWSNGTAAVKGAKALNGTRSFWEIQVSHRVFGTSIMFGIASKPTKNFRGYFTNLVGADEESWGLSHKGLVWHGGKSAEFTSPFTENTPTKIGILFDGFEGTLRYFKDNVDLGVAFRGLNRIPFFVFPIVSSTAARSEIRLASRYRLGFPSLESLCMNVITERTELGGIAALPLPLPLKDLLRTRALTALPQARLPSCPLDTHHTQPF